MFNQKGPKEKRVRTWCLRRRLTLQESGRTWKESLVAFTTPAELVDFARKALPWWGKIRERKERLCEVHGDFHPGNIRFHGDDFTVLDRARGTWGEAADDLSCLAINFIH